MKKTQNSDKGSQKGTLVKGLYILDVLREAGRPLSLSDIVELCDFDSSTTHRVLQTLVEQGSILRSTKSKRYLLGPNGVFPLSLYHPINVMRRAAQPSLILLRDESSDTAGLILYCYGERLLIEIAEGRDPWHPYYGTWVQSPLHGSASGKIFLMSLSAKERSEILGPGPYAAETPETVTDPQQLEEELILSTERGYALARNDAFLGRSAIGSPVLNSAGSIIGCFVIAGKSKNFSEEYVERTGALLRRTSHFFSIGTPSVNLVSIQLGFPPCMPGLVTQT